MKGQSWAIITVFLLVAVVLSGCVECEKDSECKDEKNVCIGGKCIPEKTGIDVYVGGTDGIVGKFVYPEFLYSGQTFEIITTFQNKGEAEVAKDALKAYIGGVAWKDNYLSSSYDATHYSPGSDVLQDSNADVMGPVSRSASKKELDGGYSEMDFGTVGGKNILTAKDAAGMTSTFVATICYPYETSAVTKACIGKEISGEEGICDPNADLEIDSSGAPVQITKISEIKSSENKYIFKIYFENKGNGKTYTKALTDKNCVTGLSAPDFGKVTVKEITLSGKSISGEGCKLEGDKSLSAGVVTCQWDSLKSGRSISPLKTETLKVTLKYNYIETFDKALTVSAS